MDGFLRGILFRTYFLVERNLSDLLSLFALLDMMIVIDDKPLSVNANSSVLSRNGELNQIELGKLHELANQTEQQLQTAIGATVDRNEQLNVLLNRSDLLMHKNQAFGIGVMDYRKDMARNRSLQKLKFIAVAVLLLLVLVFVLVLSVVLSRSNSQSSRSTNIILE